MTERLLEGRVALVTGAGRGIGAAIAEQFAEAGAAVVVADRDAPLAESSAARIAEGGARVLPLVLDIADVASHAAAVSRIESEFGGLDVLVNNAGVGPHAAFLEVTPELWDEVHSINARGTFFLTQHVAARMVEQGRGGSIINVTSVVADRVWLASTAYAASKAAVRTVTEYAAAELGPHGIRVNNLCPGPTDTPLSAPRYRDPEYRASILEVVPLRRIGTPMDLARAALFLASDQSSFTTGSTLYVEGGRRVG
ncbi:MAG TPA: SDR family NAD(P)-dependent oxidoreductase [Pseudolysinimonas sp.]|nr:SDR family NAD(P)-dependent oxidoreductase [Pseudolysinimonas sp.]